MAKKINVKLILELRDAHMSRNAIASTRHISRHSVSDVMRIADEKNITYSDVRCMSEEEVYRMFYPEKHAVEGLFQDPDYEYIHKELCKTGVTLKLLCEEYREKCIKSNVLAMGYSKFCAGYSEYTIINKLTNHLEHKPGEKIEVDWSGSTMSYVDKLTGEVITVYLFVATLPYSRYAFVEPTLNMKMETFIRCHVRMFAFFDGVARRLVSDNLKTGVVSHPREGDIILTADYEALGEHYLTAIMPAGINKPKQKSSVEGTVGNVATAIIARLRNHVFNSFEDLAMHVSAKLYDYNHGAFQKRDGSRYDAYMDEKEYLHALPPVPYEIATWVYGRSVNLDFHVVFEKNRYSCPYQYSGKKVDLRVTDRTVEIYFNNDRITTHSRIAAGRKNQYSTHPEDMPEKFKVTPWDETRIRNYAAAIGQNTAKVIDAIFRSVSIKEQGYNPSLSVLRLSKTYSEARLETACEFALRQGIKKPRYHHLKAILAANQDIVYLESIKTEEPDDDGLGYLRGSDYYINNEVRSDD